MTQQQQYEPQHVVPPEKRHRGLKITAIVVGVVSLFGIIAMCTGGPTAETTQPRPAATAAAPKPAATTTAPAAIPSPKVSDFTLTPKILHKACFGDAGCNLSYRVDVAYAGSAFDPTKAYEVTYTVRGDESGPQINTFTILDGEAHVATEEYASTPSSGTKLTITATDVSEL